MIDHCPICKDNLYFFASTNEYNPHVRCKQKCFVWVQYENATEATYESIIKLTEQNDLFSVKYCFCHDGKREVSDAMGVSNVCYFDKPIEMTFSSIEEFVTFCFSLPETQLLK